MSATALRAVRQFVDTPVLRCQLFLQLRNLDLMVGG
jgi:hypothetical protein